MLAGCWGDNSASQSPEIKNAWIRSTVPGQKVTGAFMTIIAPENLHLVGVSTNAANVTELRGIKMDGDVMKLHTIKEGVALPAGKPVKLKPGSYHVMLAGLKQTMPKDTTVTMTLRFRNAKGVESQTEVEMPVTASAPKLQPQPSGAVDVMSVSSPYSIRRKN